MLFGFERRQSLRRYEPRNGNAFGGELLLRDEEGAPLPAEALSVALGGANRAWRAALKRESP